MSYEIKKIYTENPFVDALLYCTKQLAFGCVIKSQDDADNGETTESIKSSNRYIDSIEGKEIFELYTYTKAELIEAGITDTDKIASYLDDNSRIPIEYRSKLASIGARDCINSYVEENEYYRKITGKPPIDEYGIPIRDYEYLIPEASQIKVTYVHEVTTAQAIMLNQYGILDQIKSDYPNAHYLNYLTNGISIYKARKAYQFQLLYVPTTDYVDIDDLFTKTYESNRIFVMSTMYSSAYKIRSIYYDGFIAMLLLLMTMMDMLSQVQDHIIRKDILDARCIEYLFSMYGIPYYKSIPLKYQVRMCKNINDMIRYKSCAQEMLNFVSLFGAQDIEIFKYFIIRDRNKDRWGHYVYNTLKDITSKENDVVYYKNSIVPIANTTIPFPFNYYLEKGNEILVWLDNIRVDPSNYIITGNTISFLNNISNGKTNIRYDFYYDITTEGDITPNTTDAIHIDHTEVKVDELNNIPCVLPYDTYLDDGNQISLYINGVLLSTDSYTIEPDNRINIKEGFAIKDDLATIVFIYFKGNKIKYTKTIITATDDNQSTFPITEPFTNYLNANYTLFITDSTSIIPETEYTINDNALTFNARTFSKNENIILNYIYSVPTSFVSANLPIKHEVQVITAVKDWQVEFDLTFPVSNYLKNGYKIYVKLREWYLDEDYYELYDTKLLLDDNSIGLKKGESIEIHYVYIPVNDNMLYYKKSIESTMEKQIEFNMTYPLNDYFKKENKIIVDSAGSYLQEGIDYKYNDDYSKLIILDTDYAINPGQRLNLIYIYNNTDYDYLLKVSSQLVIANSNNTYNLSLPFYPYFETNQNILVFHNNKIISPSNIIRTGDSIVINDSSINTGDKLYILYLYNNKYILDKLNLLTLKESTVDISTLTTDSEYYSKVPVPFTDYISNDWPLVVDNNGTLIDSTKYEILNNNILFNTPSDILKYKSLNYTFVYKNNSKYIIVSDIEDFNTDISLKFIASPLENSSFVTDLKNRKHERNYDVVTDADMFWNGQYSDKNGMREYFKYRILEENFNYARTKYMGINYIVKLTDMAFEIPYFYNMFYDDVFIEENLTAIIPSISLSVPLKISGIFIYMTILSYMYSGIDDKILDTPTKILYVKGFNFSQDLPTLKQFILDQRRVTSDYDVWGFITKSTQIEDMKEFINIYTTNKNIYQTILKGMYDAKDANVYFIWKKLYDSLMAWKYNLEFFKLSSGKTATTFTEYLEEKSPLLYKDLTRIQAITDQETRENEIVTMISDIVYILESYIDSSKFKYIYMNMPGVSGEYLIKYLYTMINFFKSYKVTINEINTYYDLQDDDHPENNFIRPIDKKTILVKTNHRIYLKPRDSIHAISKLNIRDVLGFKEKFIINYNHKIKQYKEIYCNATAMSNSFTKYIPGSFTIEKNKLNNGNGIDIIGTVSISKNSLNDGNGINIPVSLTTIRTALNDSNGITIPTTIILEKSQLNNGNGIDIIGTVTYNPLSDYTVSVPVSLTTIKTALNDSNGIDIPVSLTTIRTELNNGNGIDINATVTYNPLSDYTVSVPNDSDKITINGVSTSSVTYEENTQITVDAVSGYKIRSITITEDDT